MAREGKNPAGVLHSWSISKKLQEPLKYGYYLYMQIMGFFIIHRPWAHGITDSTVWALGSGPAVLFYKWKQGILIISIAIS